MPPAPAPMTSMLLLPLFQSAGTDQVFAPVVVRKMVVAMMIYATATHCQSDFDVLQIKPIVRVAVVAAVVVGRACVVAP